MTRGIIANHLHIDMWMSTDIPITWTSENVLNIHEYDLHNTPPQTHYSLIQLQIHCHVQWQMLQVIRTPLWECQHDSPLILPEWSEWLHALTRFSHMHLESPDASLSWWAPCSLLCRGRPEGQDAIAMDPLFLWSLQVSITILLLIWRHLCQLILILLMSALASSACDMSNGWVILQDNKLPQKLTSNRLRICLHDLCPNKCRFHHFLGRLWLQCSWIPSNIS